MRQGGQRQDHIIGRGNKKNDKGKERQKRNKINNGEVQLCRTGHGRPWLTQYTGKFTDKPT